MKNYLYICICFILLAGCITRYEAPGVKNLSNILVVEGIISDSITTIILSRSVGLADKIADHVYIDNASLYVECNDGTVSGVSQFAGRGTYNIETGDLSPTQKYRLKMYLDGEEYQSEFLSPLFTPDFDLAWTKEDDWTRISISVSTQDVQDQSRYYLWSYKEDWEYTARVRADSLCIDYEWVAHDIYSPGNWYYCWKKDSSRALILENAERLTESKIINQEIHSMSSIAERLSVLYHIEVRQNLIRKEAYTYFSNMQKNVEQTGGIFVPIPAEVQGNLQCITSPHIPVIGYVEVSSVSRSKCFITATEAYNEALSLLEGFTCAPVLDPFPPECYSTKYWMWVVYRPIGFYVKTVLYTECINCLTRGGTKNKPSFWPNDHQ